MTEDIIYLCFVLFFVFIFILERNVIENYFNLLLYLEDIENVYIDTSPVEKISFFDDGHL